MSIATQSSPSLDELASTARYEHEQTFAAVSSALTHALRCGEALVEARERLRAGCGDWAAWVASTGISIGAAQNYRRLALSRAVVLSDDCPRTISGALAHLRQLGQPAIGPTGGHNRTPLLEDDIAAMRRLREAGTSYERLGEQFGVSRAVVQQRLDPEFQRRSSEATKRHRRRARAAKKALEREQRDQAVKRAGGKPAKAYSLLRQCASELDRAAGEAEDEETRLALSSALRHVHKAEDEVVRALRLERTR